jgi:hypothetical protein
MRIRVTIPGESATKGGKMYATIRRYEARDVSELSRRVQEEFVPMVRDIPGFIGYYVVDGGDGKIASITVCEDSAGVEESNRRAAEWVGGGSVSDYLQSGPEVLAGEVTASS